ncbi:hypothetical protein [Tannerella sp.]|uniref:hypothetical protein n=1 Tax=Tannerella sp. TaxID=2382127 RepID=UPI0026DAA41F|nr:hypothetical protein [Tannerella sp.]MDO4703128.1 hypothetical protein [Tannerella sp.]
MKKFILLLTLSWLAFYGHAQDTEFWFVSPDFGTYLDRPNPRPQYGVPETGTDMPIFIVFSNQSKTQTAHVTLELWAGNATPERTTYSIPPGGSDRAQFLDAAAIAKVENPRAAAGTVTNYGIRVTSDVGIIVYYQLMNYTSGDLFTLKGAPALGTEFYIPFATHYTNIGATVPGLPQPRDGYDQIDIVATEDNTYLSFELKKDCDGFPAGTHTNVGPLNRGQTLKLKETVMSDNPHKLTGSKITATKPIAVTMVQDFTGLPAFSGHDAMGDQLVPTDRLGKRYAVIRGYTGDNTPAVYRLKDILYLMGTKDGTNITLKYFDASHTLQTVNRTVNAGQITDFEMGNSHNEITKAITVEASEPVYCYHASGYGKEEGGALIPSLYSIGQSALSFYQSNFNKNAIFVIFRDTCERYFTIGYDGNTYPLAVTDMPLPGIDDWKWGKIELPDAAKNKLVKIENSESPFSLGYFNSAGGTGNYGYLSGFGQFKFDPDTLWRCASNPQPKTLMGGYAKDYKWILPDSSIVQGPSRSVLKARTNGPYVLLMDQDLGAGEQYWVRDTCWVLDMQFQAAVNRKPNKPAKLNVPQLFDASVSPSLANSLTYHWTFEGGKPERSSFAAPLVTWNSTGEKKVTLRLSATAGAGVHQITCDTTIELTVDVRSAVNGYFVNGSVTGGKGDGSDWENAFPRLEDALSVASQGDYVWVAQGEYTPPKGGSFLIDYDSVHVYGGFKGTETNLSERNPAEYRTVLKGNGNSVVIFDGSTTYTNGSCGTSRDARLDGFTVLGGTAREGAGILFRGGASGTVANCIVKENTARESGGGIYIGGEYAGCTSSDDVLIYNTELSHNRASTGGGLYNNGSNFLSVNNTLSGNMASSASGFYNSDGNPVLRNTIVWGNLTDGSLGGDVLNAGGSPYWKHCNVSGWGATPGRDGGNNMDRDPLFLRKGYDSDLTPRKDGDYRLSQSSPSVNRGYNPFVLSGFRNIASLTLSRPTDGRYVSSLRNDLSGRARIYDDVVDMGAYEYHPNQGTVDLVHSVEIGRYAHVTTSPGQGFHYVRSQSTFTLVLTPEPGYTLEGLKVTTGSKSQDELGFMKVTHNADGTVTVQFRHVIDPLKVRLTGVSPVSNISVEQADEVWSSNGVLYVRTGSPKDVYVYSLTGQLLHKLASSPGERTLSVSRGVYIVKLGTDTVRKVVVR